ncbi:MAG: hypothetical protein ACE5SW_04905 [Nitrososphaeraceae archaeon]
MSDNSQTPIWPLITGVATLSLSAILVILKSGILVSILFLLLGSSLVLAWYYFYSKKKFPSRKKGAECACQVCGHDNSQTCFSNQCACCIIMKDNKVVGHSNNPLQ